MKLLRRLVLPVICLVMGLGALAMTGDDSGPVTCAGHEMKPTDTCVNIIGNSSRDLSYDQQEAKEHRVDHAVRLAGWIVSGLAGLAILYVLGTARSGGKPRRASADQLKLVAANREELARQHGWEYRASEPRVLASATTGLLASGQQRQAKNVLVGAAGGRAFAVFDFLRRAADGPQKGQLVGTTVWQVYLPGPLPTVELWDQRPFVDRKQYQPLDPADPKGYVVKAASAEAARRVLSPAVMAVVRDRGLNCVLIDGSTLVSHRDGFYSAGKAEALLVSDLEALLAVAAVLPAESSQVAGQS